MLILILIDFQFLHNVAFSFEKDSNGQNHSSSGSHHPINNSPQYNSIPPAGESLENLSALLGKPCLFGLEERN